jgi:Tol biopolymer transport system component
LLWSNRFRASWDIDLSHAIRITADSGMSAYGALAPDASWLVYASDKGGDGPLHLWRKPVNGGDPFQLTFGQHNHTDPDISPDGKWIAFESSGEPRGAYLVPASGGEKKLVAYFGTGPKFSPNGEWLAYTVSDPLTGFGRVAVVPAHRERVPSEPSQLAYDFQDAHTPMWIPPGDRLLICGTRRSRGGPQEEHDLWVISRWDRSAIKTGAFEKLAETGLDVHADLLGRTTFQRLGENLIFPARSGARVGLWRLPISTKTWRVTGKPLPVSMATIEQQIHPSLQSGKLAFTSANAITNVWAIPLDANNAKPSGVPQRLTNGTLDELSPSISQDGRTLVFLSASSPPGLHLYKKDLPHGLEAIVSPGEETNRVKISADGGTAYYRVMEGPSGGIKRQAIHLADLRTSESRRVCDDCGAPTSVSPDGRIVIFETGNAIPRLGALRVDTGEHGQFARHSHHAMKSARISPDGRWLAFHLDRGLDGKQIFVAPFRNAARIEEADWIPITEPGGNDEEVWWSPNGRYLYFLSARDGWHCVWAREFDPGSPRNTHQATAIQHFHHSRLTPLSFIRRTLVYAGLSAAHDRLVLSLTEITSSVWVADVTGRYAGM